MPLLPHGARMDAKGYFRLRRHAGSTPESIAAHEVRYPRPAASARNAHSADYTYVYLEDAPRRRSLATAPSWKELFTLAELVDNGHEGRRLARRFRRSPPCQHADPTAKIGEQILMRRATRTNEPASGRHPQCIFSLSHQACPKSIYHTPEHRRAIPPVLYYSRG